MRNIVDAIIEVVKSPKYELEAYSISHNRANQMGAALEDYIKDIFAGTVDETDLNVRNRLISETFLLSWQSKQSTWFYVKEWWDAIEVKKIEAPNAALALNSSYPKAKLYSDSKMISSACKNCEEWSVRDMIYAVGVLNNDKLKFVSSCLMVLTIAQTEEHTRV